jgi:NAD(P)-dependent dehydrogenase (short-subunit alcohol dehydrogenase family)
VLLPTRAATRVLRVLTGLTACVWQAQMLMVRHFLPLMTQSKFPRIIFVSSTAGSHTVQKPDHARGPSYNASKAGPCAF